MSRRIRHRILISGTLVAETPLHVGGIEGNAATDMALSVNGRGIVYIPGTSIAGPLRHWLIEHFGTCSVESYWGRIPGKNSQVGGHASFVHIDDIELGSDLAAEIRDGVGIDRKLGTAADGIKFDREILPKGTRLPIDITLDATQSVDGRGEIRAMLEALGNGRIRLGAAKTRGLGRVRLNGAWCVREHDLHTSQGVLALLAGDNRAGCKKGGLEVLGPPAEVRSRTCRISIEVQWRAKGPVMIKANADGAGVDIMPLVTGNGAGRLAPVITGSSSKGALRSQSERILATVLGTRLDDAAKQADQIARDSLIETLYGAIKRRKKDDEATASRSGRGAVSIDDCIATTSLPAEDWQRIADEWQALPRVGGAPQAVHPPFDVAPHVAIDRWTGGAADGALFSAAEPRLAWSPLLIEVDVARLVPGAEDEAIESDVPGSAIALLLLTLKDMVDGAVPLGFGTNRGYGDIFIESVRIAVEDTERVPWAKGLSGQEIMLVEGKARFGAPDRLADIERIWKAYIDRKRSLRASAEGGP